jgi:peptide/nickel transport system substrate-binding protein
MTLRTLCRRPHLIHGFFVLAFLALGPATVALGDPKHAIAMHGEPKHPADRIAFPYVNPDAPKGGRITLGALGEFDSLNPFSIKGASHPSLNTYVYESLMVRSADEPFSLYGHIARSADMSDDRRSVTFMLRPEARFSDGQPLTADDVLHSYTLLRGQRWRSWYAKVASAERLSTHVVRFTFVDDADREMPFLMAIMPIVPKHKMDAAALERTSLEPPIGSGPYVVDKAEAGRSIVFKRNPDWWAKDLATARGRFNIDEIRIEVFRDQSAMFEAFKSGEVDVRNEDDPGRWSEGYVFPAMKDGRVVKREIPNRNTAPMSTLVFNTRRPIFADARVRRALVLLFDAEWINSNLYGGLYRRTESFFERAPQFSSVGRAADAEELALLAPFAARVDAAVIAGKSLLPKSDGTGKNRDNQRAAFKLLTEAGYKLDGRRLVDSKTGRPLTFEVLLQTRGQERLVLSYAKMLEAVGIAITIRQVDTSQYWARLREWDYDMIQWVWPATQSPGNEQIDRWGSAAAQRSNTRNYPGVASPAVDAMLDALMAAKEADAFAAAVRALDRTLRSGEYVIPLFHVPSVWLAHWRHLASPAVKPNSGFDIDTWWIAGAKP